MTAVATPDAARLVFAAVAGLILLLILIIKFKVHAMISILIGAVGIGLMAGMPLSDIIGSVNEGIGNTLKGIALLVGLGSMFGAILEESGGAQTLAVTMVRKFGDEKAAWALGITGLVVAMPVFFDAGLIILIPLAFSLAKRTKRSVLYYVIPLLAGLAVGHAFIPPTPGPVLVATMLGVDLGWVILVGIFCGIFAMIAAGPIWGSICGKKYMVEVPEHVAQQADIDESKLPKFGTIVGIIMIPLLLIIANSVAKVVPALAGIQPVLAFLGEPFMALLLATIAAMYLLGTRHGYTNVQLEKIMTKSLEPTGMILLVTACGGVLRYMLQNSGLGDVIGNAVANASLPLVLVAFIVAALVRISVGSATVAMTMAAGIISAMPGLSALSPLYLACVTAAIAGGSTVIAMLCGIPAAYALARMKFKGQTAFLGFIIVSQMFAPVVLLIGIYKVMQILNLTNSILGLIFINAAFNQAFTIWLLRGTFMSISAEMEQAATIDGCNRVQAMLRILLPVAAPGIVTTLIFIFINAWNEYTVALCLISTDTFKPLTVGINIFNGYNMIEWQYLFAASIFAIIPVVILFMSIEKNLTSGLTAGGVKG